MGQVLLQLLLTVGLTMHLVAMGVASAAPLVCIALKWKQMYRDDHLAGLVGRQLAIRSMTWLLGGIVMGVILAGLLWHFQERSFFAALAAIPRRRIWFGVAELLFFLGCMGWYAWMWDRQPQRGWLHAGLALLAATDLVYHFPPLFAAIAVLERNPALTRDELSYAEFLRVLTHRETLARTAHFLLASVAITGTMVLADAARLLRQQATGDAAGLAAWGARVALAAVVLAMLAGLFLLVELPAAERSRLLGGQWLATLFLAAGIVAAVGLLHYLMAVSLGETSRSALLAVVGLMGLVLLLMVAARQQARLSVDGSMEKATRPRGSATSSAAASFGAQHARITCTKTSMTETEIQWRSKS
jgi:hypothetical protein